MLQQCKKDNPDSNNSNLYVYSKDTTWIYLEDDLTFQTSDYLMHYPGSWWEYDGSVIYHCGEPEVYEIYSKVEDTDNIDITVQSVLVNNVEGFGAFREDNRILTTLNFQTYSIPFIDQETGLILENSFVSGDWPGTAEITHRTHLIDHLDSLEVSGITYYDVLHILYEHDIYYYYTHSGPNNDYNYFFAKDVGLVKMEAYGPFVPNDADTLLITDYYIEF